MRKDKRENESLKGGEMRKNKKRENENLKGGEEGKEMRI